MDGQVGAKQQTWRQRTEKEFSCLSKTFLYRWKLLRGSTREILWREVLSSGKEIRVNYRKEMRKYLLLKKSANNLLLPQSVLSLRAVKSKYFLYRFLCNSTGWELHDDKAFATDVEFSKSVKWLSQEKFCKFRAVFATRGRC